MTLQDHSAPPTRRLRRLTAVGEGLSLLGALAVAGWTVLAFALEDVRVAWMNGFAAVLRPGETLLGAVIAAVPAAAAIYAFVQSARLFRALRTDAVFSATAARALVSLAWGAGGTAFASVAARAAIGSLASFAAPRGVPQLAISLSSNDLAMLLFAVLALTFALVLEEARRADEDSRSIV